MANLIGRDGLRTKGIGFDDSTIYRKVKAGKFPKPVKMGNRHCWIETEVDDYIDSLIAERT
jgi:predicted DNA-binding transcriptional regulator AlpA